MLLQQLLLSPSLSPWNGRKMIPGTCSSIRKVKYFQICLWFVHYYYSQPWSLAMITNEYEAFIRVQNAVHTLQLPYINFTSDRVKKSYLHFLHYMHVGWTHRHIICLWLNHNTIHSLVAKVLKFQEHFQYLFTCLYIHHGIKKAFWITSNQENVIQVSVN